MILRDPTGFDDESRQQVSRFFEQVRTMLASALGVGQAAGLVRDCDNAIISAIALGGVREVLVRMLAAHAEEAPESSADFAQPERIADEVLEFIFSGIGV